jgi:chemotaxis protein MotB
MPKQGHNNEGSGAKIDPNAWMVTFGDLIMLLLTFFVMLLTMKSMDGGHLKERLHDVASTTGPLEHIDIKAGGSFIEGSYDLKKPLIIENSRKFKEVLDLLEGIERKRAGEHHLERLQQLIDIDEDDRGVVVSMECDNLFDSGKAEVRSDRFPLLDSMGRLFRNMVNDIIVMGHSDNQAVGVGEFESNYELSFYRAMSVMFYLTEGLGLKPERFATGGYGDLRPRYPNDSEENRSKNRRVEFIIRKQER